MIYKSKVRTVEAVQFDGENVSLCLQLIKGKPCPGIVLDNPFKTFSFYSNEEEPRLITVKHKDWVLRSLTDNWVTSLPNRDFQQIYKAK